MKFQVCVVLLLTGCFLVSSNSEQVAEEEWLEGIEEQVVPKNFDQTQNNIVEHALGGLRIRPYEVEGRGIHLGDGIVIDEGRLKFITIREGINEPENQYLDQAVPTKTRLLAVPIPIPFPIPVEKLVPFPVKVPLKIPYPVADPLPTPEPVPKVREVPVIEKNIPVVFREQEPGEPDDAFDLDAYETKN